MKKKKTREDDMRLPVESEPEEIFLSCQHGEEAGIEVHEPEEMAYVRLKADFENLKKRQESEIGKEVGRRLRDFFSRFLLIQDDLGRALTFCAADTEASENFKEGIRLIHKRMEDLLAQQGVKRVEAVGTPFDPIYHEAVLMEDAPDVPENTVTEELESGYLFQGILIRPAKVKVAK